MYCIKKEEYKGKTRLKLSGWMTAVVLVLASIFITLVCLWLQPGPISTVLHNFFEQPLLILLNYFPALCFTAIAYFLTKNVFYGSAISGGILAVLSYVNLIKCEGRGDPLVPADIGLVREAMNAVGEYKLSMHWGMLIAIVLMIGAAIALGYWVKSANLRLPWRLTCAVATLAVFISAVHFVYCDRALYKSFSVPSQYNISSVFNTLGFNYCFWYNYDLYPVDKPEDFSKSEVESWIAAEPGLAQEPAVQPNVIMVMCEAFTDLADEPVFDYDAQSSPLAAFHQVAASDRAVSGHIVVSNYGAGTANTEFDVLTGMQTNLIGEGTTSALRVVRKQTKTVASLLADSGYHTFFMHPGQSWFYNRASVYERFGISDQIFVDAFDSSDYKGTMISDAAFLDELKQDLQSRLVESEQPLFAYTVTIQNHQSYGYAKYPTRPEPAKVTVPVSDAAMEQLSVYFEGIRDSSQMLLELTQYLDTLDEPTVLVFFGDHRPNVGTACDELGLGYNQNETPQSTVATYATPYVIWSNQAYADAVDLRAAYAALELPENGYLSDNYLGAVVMELLGRTGQDAYMDFLNTLRRSLSVVRIGEDTYCHPDGTYTRELTKEQTAQLKRLRQWIYYQLKY